MVRGGWRLLSPFDAVDSEATGRPGLPVLRAHTTYIIRCFPLLPPASVPVVFGPFVRSYCLALRSAAASLPKQAGRETCRTWH